MKSKVKKYDFSCLLQCEFCGGRLTRQKLHRDSQHSKVICQFVTTTKKGKKHCPNSKDISKQAIEGAFVESYNIPNSNNKDILYEFLEIKEKLLNSSSINKKLEKALQNIEVLETKKNNLVDLRLEDIIDSETYEIKFTTINKKQDELIIERKKLQEIALNENDIKQRLKEFKNTLEQNKVLSEFDRHVFESIVEKEIVGGFDNEGDISPI